MGLNTRVLCVTRVSVTFPANQENVTWVWRVGLDPYGYPERFRSRSTSAPTSVTYSRRYGA